jgi:hypothetical protein
MVARAPRPYLYGAGALTVVAAIAIVALAGGGMVPSIGTGGPSPQPTPVVTPYNGPVYAFGPIVVKRAPKATVSTYTVEVTSLPAGTRVTWALDAPCGTLSPGTFSAQVLWSSHDSKVCDPGGDGPFPGIVTATVTTKLGTWQLVADADRGTFGAPIQFH